MKKTAFVSAFLVGCLLLLTNFKKPNTSKRETLPAFVILELFTSEGCSSCPPADEVLNQIVSDPVYEKMNVIGLAFHVSYWNHASWSDPFSNALYDARQQQYASKLGASVYTPQLVVNGQKEFVGSMQGTAKNSIRFFQRILPESGVTLGQPTIDANKITVTYNLKGDFAGKSLNFALVEEKVERSITGGENSGAHLLHRNVVRDFKTISSSTPAGTSTFKIPSGFDTHNAKIAAFIQNPGDLKITGATLIAIK